MKKNEGGPAFPVQGNNPDNNPFKAFGYSGHPGMSLRDWFAGQFIVSMHQQLAEGWHKQPGESAEHSRHLLACEAYGFADAMIAQREKP